MITLVAWALALSGAGAVSPQDKEPLSPELMAQELVQAAASTPLPQQIDPTTRMVDVRASGLSLTYFYETSEDASEAGFRRFFARNNLPKICADEDVRFVFQNGVVFRYSYVATGSQTKPFVIEVGSADCGE